ncbi:arginine--tRNA ligase [Candidatus Saccharibacteria bacterium]|nr:arginine--tRNA ligase [Candidatus Saccharibacteria bacterium]
MEKIKEVVEKVVKRVFEVEIEAGVERTPEGIEADFATNVAMKLAKEVRRNPREIAEEIRKGVEEDGELEGAKIEVVGPGFLNFTLNDKFFIQEVEELLDDFDKKVKSEQYRGKVVVTEFSDPNPFKVLHVGHLYTSIVGEGMSRLIEFAGGEVHRTNFGGDVGLHVAKTIHALLACGRQFVSSDASRARPPLRGSRSPDLARKLRYADENKTVSPLVADIELLAECYVRGTRLYEEDERARGEIKELNKKIYQIAERGEGNEEGLSEEDKRLAEMYWQGRALSYKYFEQFYERIGVKFEKFYPESSVVERGRETVLRELGNGVYERSEGAVVFSGEKYGLHTRVFINQEGIPTYETKDVGLLLTKNEDYHFDESVVITGNDIVDYMKVVLKSVEQYAPELVRKTRHVTHGNVRLPGNEKMSSRKGNFIKAVDILDDVFERTKSEIIGLAAIKYAFLKYRVGGDIEFDAEESVRTVGNSGVYLLYSAVRGKKIINSALRVETPDILVGLNEFERELAKKFMEYRGVLREAVEGLAPNVVCKYLFELAQEFSRFYEHCRVVGDEREAERVKLVKLFVQVMEHGLFLLGITVPEEM